MRSADLTQNQNTLNGLTINQSWESSLNSTDYLEQTLIRYLFNLFYPQLQPRSFSHYKTLAVHDIPEGCAQTQGWRQQTSAPHKLIWFPNKK